MGKQDKPKRPLLWPTTWLTLGILLALGAAISSSLGYVVAAGALGGLTAAIAIVLTYVIAHRQAKEALELNSTVTKIDNAVSDLAQANERIYQLTLSVAERDSAQDYESDEEDASDENALVGDDEPPTGQETHGFEEPPYAAEALSRLRSVGSLLSQSTASWRQKVPDPPIRGNHGWFVESKDPAIEERWYVRKGRYWNIRKAMPREFLDALEAQQGINPRTIKLDFQLKEHGLASWYARTYDGSLWRVSKPNRNRNLGVQTMRVDEDLESS